MDYEEFKKELGPITVPEGIIENKLIKATDSAHVIVVLKYATTENGVMSVPLDDNTAKFFLKMLKLVKARKAVHGNDYIVTMSADDELKQIRLGLHTLKSFISREDFVNNEVT